MAPRKAFTSLMTVFEPSVAPAMRSEWPPTYGQGVQGDVRAVFNGPLKNGAEQRVVAGDERRMTLRPADHIGNATHHRDVDQAVCWIRRRLDEDHGYPTFAHGVLRHRADRGLVDPIGEPNRADGQTRKRLGEEGLSPAIKRLGMKDHVARTHE